MIAAQRCHHHDAREAVARCPECGSFFCRECITEHDDRVICASCLANQVRADSRPRRGSGVGRYAVCLAGFFLAWIFFYSMGRLLLLTPASVHEGTLWADHLDQP